MYNPGTNALNAINDFKLQARITGEVSDVGTFTDANIVGGSFSINNQCTSDTELTIGNVYVGELNITLTGLSWDRYTLYGKQITAVYQLYVEGSGWIPIPLGIYNISEVEITNAGVDIRAYDNMSLFDVPFAEASFTGTPYALASAACTACGLTLATTQTQFNAFANHGVALTATQTTDADGNKSIPQFSTYRDVIAAIAQVSCCNVIINRSGEVVFKPYPSTAVATIDTAHRKMGGMTADFETYYDGIIVTDPTTKAQTKYTRSNPTGLTMDLGDNPFINTEAIRNAILNGLTFRFHPFKMSVLNAPLYDLMDCVYLPDGVGDGTKLYCITKYNWTYHGSYTISGTGQDPKLVAVASAAQRTAARANFIAAQKVTSDEMDEAIEHATSMITGGEGGYYRVLDTNGDGMPDETVWMNTPDIDTATKLWRFNQNGLGHSNNGYEGPYDLAMTADGEIVANRIRVGVLGDEAGLNSWNMVNGAFRLRSSDGFTDINLTGDSNGSYISVTDTTNYARATLRGKAGSLILSHSEDDGASYTEVGSVWVDGGVGSSNANIDFYRVGRYNAAPTVDLRRNQLIARWDYTANKSYTYGNEFLIRPDAGVYNQTTVFTIAKWNADLSTTELRAGQYSFRSPSAVSYSLVDWDATKATAGTHLRVSYATISGEANIETVNSTTVNATTAKATTFRTVNGEATAWSSETGDNYVRAYNYQVGNETTHKDIAWLNSAGTTVYIRAGFYSFTDTSGTNRGVIYSDSNNRICFYGHLYYAGSSSDTAERGFYVNSTAGTINFISDPNNGVKGIYVNAHGTGPSIYPLSINTNNVVTFRGQTYNAGTDSDSTNEGAFYATSSAGKIHLYSNPNSSAAPRGLWISAHGTGSSKSIIYADANNNVFVDGKTPVYTSTDQTIEGSKYFNTLTMRVSTNYPEVNFQGRSGTTTGKTGTLTQEVTATYNRFYFNMYHMANGVQQNSYVDIYRLPVSGTDNASHNYEIITTKNLTDIPDASATVRGMVSTGAQTFAGAKRFTGGLVVSTTATVSRPIEARTDNSAIIFIHQYGATEVGVATSASSDDYVKALIKTLCEVYPNRTNTIFHGSVLPNSRRLFRCFIYDTSRVNNTTGLPEYAFGEMIGWGGSNDIYRFNITTYNYTSRII